MNRNLKISGLEVLEVSKEANFINIGERTNVAGSRKFLNLIKDKKYNEALAIARNQIEFGAQVIDINMDDAMLDGKEAMVTFLRLIASEPDIAKVPIMIDSSNWEIIEAGLKNIQGKPIVNSISLKAGEEDFIKKAEFIKKIGAAVVVIAFDEKGQADSYERKIEICKRCYDILTKKLDFPAEDIIFDPNVFPVATGMNEHRKFAEDFFRATAWIKENLPYANISGGISNVSFSFRGNNFVREAMHSVFLYHAKKAGMNMGIVNSEMLMIYDNIPSELLEKIEDVYFDKDEDATNRLIEYASTFAGVGNQANQKSNALEIPINPKERIIHALVNGIEDKIEETLDELIPQYTLIVDIIEGPLMEGMNKVGDLFSSGKMFLPQVVKSARVMRRAVNYIKPMMALQQTKEAQKRGKILLATVKGDVHDIGKNIVSVVLSCNNFDIIDLGVMVPAETIIDTAISEQVDIIGLSGLITPSLEEMINVAKLMENKGLDIPLMVGGATTSVAHTALKIAPIYSGAVLHVNDASTGAIVVNNLISNNLKNAFIKAKQQEYETVRNKILGITKNFLPIEEANARKFKADFSKTYYKPNFIGNKLINDVSIEELSKLIDWDEYVRSWEMNVHSTNINEKLEINKLLADTKIFLQEIINKKMIKAEGVIAFYPAISNGNQIDIYKNEDDSKPFSTIHTLRQQKTENAECLAFSDFVKPSKSNGFDYIGFFALTAGIGVEEHYKEYESQGKYFEAFSLSLLANRLAEAFSGLMFEKIQTQYADVCLCEGIRPAIGYPSMPDHSEKETIFNILEVSKMTGIKLSENYAMSPLASVCGMYIMHPQAKYFAVGKINEDQIKKY